MNSAIADNLRHIQDRIRAAQARARRDAAPVTLIAVTKSVGLAEIQALSELGVEHFAENRVHLAEPKISAFQGRATWHMIGNIQRRKAKDVVRMFQRVDAVDRMELADELARRAEELGVTLPILLEVNVSGEDAKHGMDEDAVDSALRHIARHQSLRVEGVMTMAPFYEEPEGTRPVFRALRALADRFQLPRVSMGMSNDFEVAIEEGATEVRIGTALFER